MADIRRLKRIGFDIDKFKTEWERATYDIENAGTIRNNDKYNRVTSSGRRFHESKTSKIKRGYYRDIIEEDKK